MIPDPGYYLKGLTVQIHGRAGVFAAYRCIQMHTSSCAGGFDPFSDNDDRCCLLIRFINSLDPDQTRHTV